MAINSTSFQPGRAKTGGRQKGTLDKQTVIDREIKARELRETQARASNSDAMPLDVMLQNMRWAHERLGQLIEARDAAALAAAPRLEAVEARIDQLLAFAQRCARDAAGFLHPQLAAIKHEHRGADGELIKPVIEITGYPEPKPSAPALPPPIVVQNDSETAH